MAVGEFWRFFSLAKTPPLGTAITAILGVLIGGITFTGSMIAFAKLRELWWFSDLISSATTVQYSAVCCFGVGSVYICLTPLMCRYFLGLVFIS